MEYDGQGGASPITVTTNSTESKSAKVNKAQKQKSAKVANKAQRLAIGIAASTPSLSPVFEQGSVGAKLVGNFDRLVNLDGLAFHKIGPK